MRPPTLRCAERCYCAPRFAPPCQVVLGFRGTPGHRLWRRLRPLLVKRGHIEVFLAQTAASHKSVK